MSEQHRAGRHRAAVRGHVSARVSRRAGVVALDLLVAITGIGIADGAAAAAQADVPEHPDGDVTAQGGGHGPSSTPPEPARSTRTVTLRVIGGAAHEAALLERSAPTSHISEDDVPRDGLGDVPALYSRHLTFEWRTS